MPFSHSAQISTIVGFAENMQPMSILDVGVGMGQYGFLMRTNLENVHLFDVKGSTAIQRPRDQWQRRIDGIEGFATYMTPVHDYAYNQIIIGEALQTLSGMPSASYDLVMAIDILEHFSKEQGYEFVRECMRVSAKACLISTPKEFTHQEVAANPLEDHRSHWSQVDLEQAGFDNFLRDAASWIGIAKKTL
jgi:2-polyprenyl-3-methyl-5-hydroxy-6-metoxy-1,4-benzoquinol methylase